jgi:toxin ParE1/3/4
VVAAAVRIGRHPQIGVVRRGLAPDAVRFLVVAGFPYVIVYRAESLRPRILRVLHSSRDLPELLRDVF